MILQVCSGVVDVDEKISVNAFSERKFCFQVSLVLDCH